MEPTLAWLDLTARDRDKMRRVLDLFTEQGTVDEMGLGTIRDTFSDALFPGTSTLQTRLRYMLFVPWIYQRLERRRVLSDDIAKDARDIELKLIRPLLDSDDPEGVFGSQAGKSLIRLPSSVYWAGLVRWGVFLPRQSQSWYHTQFTSLAVHEDELGRPDDPGVVWARQHTWHPRLPKSPRRFPKEAWFALTYDEADFLRGRIEERCSGTLLGWLASHGSSSPADSFWDDPSALRANNSIRATIELARRFSLHVEGPPLLYNLLLAERSHELHGTHEKLIEEYRQRIASWGEDEAQEEHFEPKALWSLMAREGARVVEPQRRFVEAWTSRLTQTDPRAIGDDEELRALVANRELKLKGNRARLVNEGRLLDWSGGVGLGRMDFRWSRVRQLVIDLHEGLAS
jgi:hypothetical protein